MTPRRTSARRSSGSARICKNTRRNRHQRNATDGEKRAIAVVSAGTALASCEGVANSGSSVNTPLTFRNVRQVERPLQDEWGIYDPQQAGLEALLRRLLSPAPGDNDLAHEPPPTPKK